MPIGSRPTSSPLFLEVESKLWRKGFTTAMFPGDPVSPNMQPNAGFDVAHAAANAYGISGGIPASAMPQALTVYGGNRYHKAGGSEAPLIPKGGGPAISSGRATMLNHAECVYKCKKWDEKGEKLERCLDECYMRYGPTLYIPLPQPR